MKRIKAISWLNFAFLYVYAALLIAVLAYAGLNPEESEQSTAILQGLLLCALAIIGLVLILGFLNLVFAIQLKGEMTPRFPSAMSFRMKLGLMPFFIVNFLFWAVFWLGTLNVFLILVAPVVWAVSLSTTYLFLLIEGMPNIVYTIDRFFKTRKIIYLGVAISQFIYLADIIGAGILAEDEKKANPQTVRIIEPRKK